VAASAGIRQHITESFGAQERIKLNDLHRLPLTGQPAGEQAAITKGQRPGEIKTLAEEWQPALDTIALPPGLKTGYLHQLLERGFAVAEGGEIHHVLELLGFQGKRHPEATIGGVLEGITVVVGEQNLGGHGGEESLHRFWL
jgi:hypothetical protein